MREGRDVTVVTYGALVQRSLAAAQAGRRRRHRGRGARPAHAQPLRLGGDRRQRPQDRPRAGRRTRTPESWGYGAEIAARIADELFEHLDAPVRRVAALDTFVAYNPSLEDAILPQVATVAAALRELARY